MPMPLPPKPKASQSNRTSAPLPHDAPLPDADAAQTAHKLGPIASPPKDYSAMSTPEPSGALTDNEVHLILKTTLSPQHHDDPNILKFISSYINCRDSGQASRDAGLPSNAGHYLKSRPDIHLAIQKLTERSLMKYGFDASEVVEKVREIAMVDPIAFENPDGSFKTHMKDIDPAHRRAIKKFKCKNIYGTDPNGMRIIEGQLIEVELWDKMRAAELLGREKDLFKETRKVQHDVTANMASVLLASKEKGEEKYKELRATQVIEVTPLQIEGGALGDKK